MSSIKEDKTVWWLKAFLFSVGVSVPLVIGSYLVHTSRKVPSEEELLNRVEAHFAAVAFAEENDEETAREILGYGKKEEV